jgi:hypothetical protein
MFFSAHTGPETTVNRCVSDELLNAALINPLVISLTKLVSNESV